MWSFSAGTFTKDELLAQYRVPKLTDSNKNFTFNFNYVWWSKEANNKQKLIKCTAMGLCFKTLFIYIVLLWYSLVCFYWNQMLFTILYHPGKALRISNSLLFSYLSILKLQYSVYPICDNLNQPKFYPIPLHSPKPTHK